MRFRTGADQRYQEFTVRLLGAGAERASAWASGAVRASMPTRRFARHSEGRACPDDRSGTNPTVLRRRWTSASRPSATPRCVVHDREPVLATDPWIRGLGLLRELGPVAPGAAGPGRCDLAAGTRCGSRTAIPTTSTRRRSRASATPGSSCPTTWAAGSPTTSPATATAVEVLPDATWVRISDRVRVLCIADEGQDAVLLIDVGGELVVNLNDAQDRGWGALVKRVIKAVPALVRAATERVRRRRHDQLRRRRRSTGTERPAAPDARAGSRSGADVARMTETFGATHFVPFSSFHRYQRTDSVWANEWTTPVAEYARGFRLRPRHVAARVRALRRDDRVVGGDRTSRRARHRVRAGGVRRRLVRAARARRRRRVAQLLRRRRATGASSRPGRRSESAARSTPSSSAVATPVGR